MENKQAVIMAGMACGYFRAKIEEKIEAAILEVIEANPDSIESDIRTILTTERNKRHIANSKRLEAKIAKDIANENKPISGGSLKRSIPVIAGDNFVVTVAQNNTDIHSVAFNSIRAFCENIGAQLIVCRTYYNKSGFQHPEHGADDSGIFFDPALSAYFVDHAAILGTSGALLVGNANVIPTARNPLTGFENMGKIGQDVIIPAVKIALKCTAALKGSKGKRLFSTGAITLPNYIQRKAGQVAEIEHNIGAVVVTPDDIRHIEVMPDSDGFNYFQGYYYGDAIGKAADIAALQFGDIHAEKAEQKNINDCCELISLYQPANVILHDLMDFSSRNHHNRKDSSFLFEQELAGNTVVQDCNMVTGFLADISRFVIPSAKLHIIESNHDLALERWLKEADFKEDATNAEFYLAAMREYYKSIRAGKAHNVLEHTLTKLGFQDVQDTRGNKLAVFLDGATFHDTDASVMLAGVEMGNHGHTGINGSRGSPEQYRKLGVPINTGHTHTPSICGGCYTAGVTGSLEMGYNIGASSWRIAHIVTYENGQRAIHFM